MVSQADLEFPAISTDLLLKLLSSLNQDKIFLEHVINGPLNKAGN